MENLLKEFYNSIVKVNSYDPTSYEIAKKTSYFLLNKISKLN